MDTNWRDDAIVALSDYAIILDNRDPRWEHAETAEVMEELIAQDYFMMSFGYWLIGR